MKKLKLDVSVLEVESFAVDSRDARRGTVNLHVDNQLPPDDTTGGGSSTFFSCSTQYPTNSNTCQGSCYGTCAYTCGAPPGVYCI
jgi:hypothetical protein